MSVEEVVAHGIIRPTFKEKLSVTKKFSYAKEKN